MIKINWNPDQKALRQFGLVVFVGLGVIGLILSRSGVTRSALTLWLIGVVLLSLSYLSRPLTLPFYRMWMGFGFVMGSIMSRVVMTIIFFAVLTPFALLFRVIGRDELRRHRGARGASSHWKPLPEPKGPQDYEHLF